MRLFVTWLAAFVLFLVLWQTRESAQLELKHSSNIYLDLTVRSERYAEADARAAQAYVINLDRDKSRLHRFLRRYEASDFLAEFGPVQRLAAVDGRKVRWEDVVDPAALSGLRRVHATGRRREHSELTPGAVGCYLSHLSAWSALARSGRPYALVFEDDANVPPTGCTRFLRMLSEVPADWDILLLGWEGSGTPHSASCQRVDRFLTTHAYAISSRCAKKLLGALVPMRVQVDWAMSAHIRASGMKAFGATPTIVDPDYQGTTIQTPLT